MAGWFTNNARGSQKREFRDTEEVVQWRSMQEAVDNLQKELCGQLITSAYRGAGLRHKSTKPTAWRGGVQVFGGGREGCQALKMM